VCDLLDLSGSVLCEILSVSEKFPFILFLLLKTSCQNAFKIIILIKRTSIQYSVKMLIQTKEEYHHARHLHEKNPYSHFAFYFRNLEERQKKSYHLSQHIFNIRASLLMPLHTTCSPREPALPLRERSRLLY